MSDKKRIVNYEINDFIPEHKLLNSGFKKQNGKYILTKNLYRNVVKLVIIIDLDEGYVYDNVENELGYPYPPFYNLKYGGQNLVRDEVIKNYNKCINNLIERKIFCEPEETEEEIDE